LSEDQDFAIRIAKRNANDRCDAGGGGDATRRDCSTDGAALASREQLAHPSRARQLGVGDALRLHRRREHVPFEHGLVGTEGSGELAKVRRLRKRGDQRVRDDGLNRQPEHRPCGHEFGGYVVRGREAVVDSRTDREARGSADRVHQEIADTCVAPRDDAELKALDRKRISEYCSQRTRYRNAGQGEAGAERREEQHVEKRVHAANRSAKDAESL
jgi:hypothetical protein